MKIMKNIKILSVLFISLPVLFLSGCDFAETELGVNEVEVKQSKSSFTNENYEHVVETVQDWGFTNIELVPVYDIFWGFTESGTIKSITIDGTDEFRNGDIFDKDALVVVTYSMPDHEDPSKLKYEIIWRNEDGSILENDSNVKHGELPSYDGDTPTKDGDGEFTYVFDKWIPEIYSADKEQEYTPIFISVPRNFTLETAKKVVVVGMTNIMSLDVFDETGTYIIFL